MTNDEMILEIKEITNRLVSISKRTSDAQLKILSESMLEYRFMLFSLLGVRHAYDPTKLKDDNLNTPEMDKLRMDIAQDMVNKLEKEGLIQKIEEKVIERVKEITDEAIEFAAKAVAGNEIKN